MASEEMTCKKIDSLRQLVICPICLDCMQYPTMLPCQHTFCQTCLIKTVQHKIITCAQCRVTVTLPAEGVCSLPKNIHIQSIIDVLGADTEHRFICATCQVKMNNIPKCGHCNHKYCVDCMEKHCSELKANLIKMVGELKDRSPTVIESINKFQEECKIIKNNINEVIESKILILKENERLLINEIEAYLKFEENIANKSVTKINALMEKVNSGQESKDVIFACYREVTDLITEINTNRQKRASFDPQTLTLEWKERENEVNQYPVPDSTEKEGISEHSRFYTAKQFHLKFKLVSGMLQRPSGTAISPWSEELYVVSMDTHLVHVFDLNSGRPIRCFGRRGHENGGFLCPFGVALCPLQQKVYVTDKWKHCIHVFNKDNEYLHQIGSKGKSACHFRSPESICIDGKGNIYVCDTCNDRIQVLNPDGSFHHQIGVHLMKEGGRMRQSSMFQDPTGIAVTKDGSRVIVSDFGNHRIHVFSSVGEYLLTFGQKGNLKGQFLHPECVTVDRKGFILIGDSGNGRVQIFRPDGNYVRMLGCTEEKFSWISGITITDNYEIVVCDFKNHCVQMYI